MWRRQCLPSEGASIGNLAGHDGGGPSPSRRLAAVSARFECPDIEPSELRARDTSLVGRQ